MVYIKFSKLKCTAKQLKKVSIYINVLILCYFNLNSHNFRTCVTLIELNSIWVRALLGPTHLGLRTGPLYLMFYTKLVEPCSFSKFQMARIFNFLISSESTKKEPRYVCLSESKATHSHKIWTEVSSSVPHFLQMRLLLSPIIYKYLLKMLFPVSRPITTLDCVLLKDNNRALVARSRPKILM